MAINAILVANDEAYERDDFFAIAAEMRRQAPEIRTYHVWKDRLSLRAQAVQLLRPTLNIVMTRTNRFWRLRGAVADSRPGGKLASFRLLTEAGLPLPKWTELVPGIRLDPAQWGPWVVLKPARGKRGWGIEVARTEEVAYRPPESFPEDHPGRDGPMLAQRFVYTGRWPSNYRVLTCFGEPVYCMRYEMHHHLQPPLETADGFGDGEVRGVVTSPRSPSPGGFVSDGALADDADVLELGRRIHATLGDVPMVGSDIMRDAETGELFIAEANQTSVWNLSGERGRAWLARGLDGYSQFGAIEVTARAMVAATRRLAR